VNCLQALDDIRLVIYPPNSTIVNFVTISVNFVAIRTTRQDAGLLPPLGSWTWVYRVSFLFVFVRVRLWKPCVAVLVYDLYCVYPLDKEIYRVFHWHNHKYMLIINEKATYRAIPVCTVHSSKRTWNFFHEYNVQTATTSKRETPLFILLKVSALWDL
jgi:hypothetical protein